MDLTGKWIPREKMRNQTHWLAGKDKLLRIFRKRDVFIMCLSHIPKFCQLIPSTPKTLLPSFICPSPLYLQIFHLLRQCPIEGLRNLLSVLLIVTSFLLLPANHSTGPTLHKLYWLLLPSLTFLSSKIFLLMFLFHPHTRTLFFRNNYAHLFFVRSSPVCPSVIWSNVSYLPVYAAVYQLWSSAVLRCHTVFFLLIAASLRLEGA